MTNHISRRPTVALIALVAFTVSAGAQDRLKSLPGYDQYARMAPQIAGVLGSSGQFFGRGAASNIAWASDSKSVEFVESGKRLRYDLATGKVNEAPPVATQQGGRGGRGGSGPARGRQ